MSEAGNELIGAGSMRRVRTGLRHDATVDGGATARFSGET